MAETRTLTGERQLIGGGQRSVCLKEKAGRLSALAPGNGCSKITVPFLGNQLMTLMA